MKIKQKEKEIEDFKTKNDNIMEEKNKVNIQ